MSNSVLTLTSTPGGAGYGLGTTCGIGGNAWIGADFQNGGYFEFRTAFDPFGTLPGGQGFWSMACEHLWGGNNVGWIECDFFEKFYADTTRYLSGGHWWTGPDPIVNDPAVQTVTVSGFDWTQFHTFGLLWVPGNRWQHYRDNVSAGSVTYASLPFLVNGNSQRWGVIIGSDNNPTQVDWVRVWQAPT